MKLKNVAVTRELLNEISMMLCREIIDDESKPYKVREEASLIQFQLSELLTYGFGPADDASISLVPLSFRLANYHLEMVEEMLLDWLGGDEPTHARAITIMLARQAAADTDNQLYCRDARLEFYEVLNELLASIKRCAAADDDTEDDAELDSEETHLIRSNNGTD